MKSYSKILLQTAVIDIIYLTVSSTVIQVIYVDSGVALILQYGFFSPSDNSGSTIMFIVYITITVFSHWALPVQFIYRYLTLCRNIQRSLDMLTSNRTKEFYSQISVALVVQAFVPIISALFPSCFILAAVLLNNEGTDLLSLSTTFLLSWAPVITPFSTIMIVKPYRSVFLMRLKKINITVPEAFSESYAVTNNQLIAITYVGPLKMPSKSSSSEAEFLRNQAILSGQIADAAEPLPALEDANFARVLTDLLTEKWCVWARAHMDLMSSTKPELPSQNISFKTTDSHLLQWKADWPDAAAVNRYIRHWPGIKKTRPYFQRFPTWMWRNTEVADLVHWLHDYILDPSRRAGFFGLDMYKSRPQAAEIARHRYGCLTPWEEEPANYGRAVLLGYKTCEKGIVKQCEELLGKELDYSLQTTITLHRSSTLSATMRLERSWHDHWSGIGTENRLLEHWLHRWTLRLDRWRISLETSAGRQASTLERDHCFGNRAPNHQLELIALASRHSCRTGEAYPFMLDIYSDTPLVAELAPPLDCFGFFSSSLLPHCFVSGGLDSMQYYSLSSLLPSFVIRTVGKGTGVSGSNKFWREYRCQRFSIALDSAIFGMTLDFALDLYSGLHWYAAEAFDFCSSTFAGLFTGFPLCFEYCLFGFTVAVV
uniref:Uncharacterized protein n=1 Tax=Ditylenchus dipsaci TaxID=166011 RepID=A0A915E570_9BILA